jgi:hypothetical protein
MGYDQSQTKERIVLAFLICFHIVSCCVSLIYVSQFKHATFAEPWSVYFIYDPARLLGIALIIAAFALVSVLFVVSKFSFGYLAGFYLYTMVLGYLWLNWFSALNYDHRAAGFSAAISAIALLLPALLISSPFLRKSALSKTAFDRLLTFILLLSAATVAIGAFYNFHFVSVLKIYDYRDNLQTPAALLYLLNITSSTLLPFVFACFVWRGERLKAAGVLLLLLCYYPVTLSKLALFGPAWLVFIVAISSVLGARVSTILSLLVPIFAGTILAIFFNGQPAIYYDTVNFRMITVPSSALDIYNDFFARHDLTHFCQIRFLKAAMSCPYQDQLGAVMKEAYGLGNINASLLATEGIASVGPLLAPVTAFACGLILAIGNRASADLPPRFVLISAAILPHIILNVPLTTTLVTHGAGLLFLCWYLTPREMFESPLAAIRYRT